MFARPLVSIVTATYNHARYIGQCLDSVRRQSYPNIEHIVINDGCTDDTEAVIKPFYREIVYVRQSNIGETASVNRGLSMASGDIVVVLSSDDYLYPDAIESGVNFLLFHPELSVVYPDYDYVNASGVKFRTRRVPEYDYTFMVKRHYCTPGLCTFITRKALTSAPQRDTRLSYTADFAHWLNLGLHGLFYHLPIIAGALRFHGTSASTVKGEKMAAEHIVLVTNYFNENVLPPELARLKGEAFGWANLIAGIVSRPSRVRTARYYASALRHHPLLPFELRDLKYFV
jgi:glycosyltransferase involved in cell wall biosynthesis